MTRRPFFIIVCLTLSAVAQPTSRPAPDEVERLVSQLADDDAGIRQRAQDKLVQMGAQVESRLERVVQTSKDEEAIARARAALGLIRDDRLTGSSLVTLHYHNAPVQTVLSDLAAQTGCKLVPEPPELWTQKEWPKVTLDADHVPFWTALLSICRQTDLEPDVTDRGELKITNVGDGKWADAPSVVAGPFLLQAVQATITRSVKFSRPADLVQSTELSLAVLAEPKLRVMRETAHVTLDTVLDEAGHSLLAEEGHIVPLTGESRTWDAVINLATSAKTGRKIALLRGDLNISIPVKIDSAEISDVMTARNVSRNVANRRFTLKRVHKSQGVYDVELIAFRDQLSDDEWEQFTNPTDFVKLVDDKGRPFEFMGMGGHEGGDDKQMPITLQFQAPLKGAPATPDDAAGKPAKLIWEIPSRIKDLNLPFELRNLPLP